jgi:hypothetical protein
MTTTGEPTSTYWKLTELDGQPVVVGAAREPHLRLRAAAVGDRLTLYAQDRPVARFVAVYFQ